MEKMIVEINGGIETCGRCRHRQNYSGGKTCRIFRKILPRKDIKKDIFLRLPECIAGCKEYKEMIDENN